MHAWQQAHMRACRGVTTLPASCALAFASSSSSSSLPLSAPYAAASATDAMRCNGQKGAGPTR